LPKVLQGEAITLPQEKENTPLGFEQEAQKKGNPEKVPQDIERPPQNKEALQMKKPKIEAERRSRIPPKSSNITPPSSPSVDVNMTKATKNKGSTKLGSPIASLTPLQSTFGFP
jgi:hypothetical protein